MSAYQQLETIFASISDLEHIAGIAGWDEAVMMPAGAGARRATAMATLHKIRHETLVTQQVGQLIQQAKQDTAQDPWQLANLAWMEKLYINATCLPPELVSELTIAKLRSEQAWRTMREQNNWNDFKPYLEKVLALVKESANIRANIFKKASYDILIDDYSPGLSQQVIDPIFNELKLFLPGFIQEVMAKQQSVTYHSLDGYYPIAKQTELALALMRAIGFDFNHGRLDVSHHPFTGGDSSDVRITTRYVETEFITSMMAVCHETGHGMYELGLPTQYASQPVGQALGMAIHESQSLLVEMQACRSPHFLSFMAKKAQEFFGHNDSFTPENFFNQYTRVKPSFIRVDADELTYPLHVILRYEIEKQLITDDVSVSDLPDLWDHYMQTFFGISTSGNYKNGVMQDVHWPSASFGYFPAYTMGAIIAAQFYQTAVAMRPEITTQLAQGNFSALMEWLRENVHGRGSLHASDELIKLATKKNLSLEPYLLHLQQRYLPE